MVKTVDSKLTRAKTHILSALKSEIMKDKRHLILAARDLLDNAFKQYSMEAYEKAQNECIEKVMTSREFKEIQEASSVSFLVNNMILEHNTKYENLNDPEAKVIITVLTAYR